MSLWPKARSLWGGGGGEGCRGMPPQKISAIFSGFFSCILTSIFLFVSILKWIDSENFRDLQYVFSRVLSGLHPRQTNVDQLVLGNSRCARKTHCNNKQGKTWPGNRNEFYLSPTDCQHVVVSFIHTNPSLSTRVGQHLFVV